jgi:hypothetical protein
MVAQVALHTVNLMGRKNRPSNVQIAKYTIGEYFIVPPVSRYAHSDISHFALPDFDVPPRLTWTRMPNQIDAGGKGEGEAAFEHMPASDLWLFPIYN